MTETMGTTTAETRLREAARTLGRALADSPAFEAFERADAQLRADEEAQQALAAMREAQQRLGWRARSGALSDDERREVMTLNAHVRNQESVQAVQNAQADLMAEARAAADAITDAAGVDFASSCATGSC